MPRDHENEHYELERDCRMKMEPVQSFRATSETPQAENSIRRKKPKAQRNHGEVAYTITRRERRAKRRSMALARRLSAITDTRELKT